MKFLNFLRYNNAVPLVIFALFLSAGGAYAATNPGVVLSKQQQVLTVDNTYIANKDLSNYTPTVTVKGVTEDADSYTVSYTISTIDIDNYVWKDVIKSENMVVSKDDLHGGDLGLYVTRQFKNLIANQIAFLEQVQEKERKQVSQQTVATTYGGLIGKFLTSSTETLPGYVPVAVAPSTPDITTVAGESASSTGIIRDTTGSGGPVNTNTGNNSSNNSSQTTSNLSLQVLGDNPAMVDIYAAYTDLGALLIDQTAPNLIYSTFVDGAQQNPVHIDTRSPGTHTIEYRAVDQNGVLVSVQRTVIVSGTVVPPPVVPQEPAQKPSPVVTPDPTPTPDPRPATTADSGTTASSTGDTQ